MTAQTFLALGGPLNGLQVTEQYAGPDYRRFNSASGERYPLVWAIQSPVRMIRVNPKSKRARDAGVQPFVPKCVLVYFREPKGIEEQIVLT